MHIRICTYTHSLSHILVQNFNLNQSERYQNSCQAHPCDKDSQDALNYRSFSAKEPQIIGLFCGKWPVKIRHPMGLRHLVSVWQRLAVCLIFIGQFSQKSHIISGCFSKRDLQLKASYASSPPCICVTQTHPWAFHAYFICVTSLIHVRDILAHMRASFICVIWLIHMRDITHPYTRHDMTHEKTRYPSPMCVLCLLYTRNMTHLYAWHPPPIYAAWYDSPIYARSLTHMRCMPLLYAKQDSCICVTCLMYVCLMPLSYVKHDSSTCETSLTHMHFIIIHMRLMPLSYGQNDSSARETSRTHMHFMLASHAKRVWSKHKMHMGAWRIHMRDITPSYAFYASFICKTWLICMRDMTKPYVWHAYFVCVTWLMPTTHTSYGNLRSVGSIKL